MHNKLLDRYRQLPKPVKASLWFTVCNATQKGIALLSTPIFTRLLTTDQYGIYTVYQSWYQIISIFATLNLYYGVFNNGMTKYSDDRRRFTSSVQGLSTVLTIGLFVLYLVMQDFWTGILELSPLYVYAMFAELLFIPAFNFWAAYERYDYKYKGLVIVTLIMAVGSPLAGVIAVLSTSYKAEARVLSYVCVQVCIGLVFYIFNLRKGKKFFVKEYWKFALVFNIPLIPHYLSSTILNQADRLMIGNMVGKAEAAIYSVAYNVGSMMTIIITAINNSFTPYMYKSIKVGETDGIRENSKSVIFIVGIACIIAMGLGPEIISIFATKEYYAAIWVIPPVACAVYFKFLYPLFSTIEFYYEKTYFVMLASCAGAVANIILNYIFIGIYGYFAAGYTTLACYIIYSFAHYFFQRKVLRIAGFEKDIFDMKYIAVFSSVVMFCMVGMMFLYPYKIIRYLAVLACAYVFVKGLSQNKQLFSKKF